MTGFRLRHRRSGDEAGADGVVRERSPEEIGAATQPRLLGARSRLGPVRGRDPCGPATVSQPTGRLTDVRADELLLDLDPTQRAAVTEPVVPLAILAPAGSGKTRALTRRIAWQAAEGNLDPNHVLAVTFTRKAAGELRGRLSRLGVRGAVTAGTFHAVALAQLRRRHADAGTTMPAILDRKARLLGPLLGGATGAELAVAINEIASEIEWAKARRIRPRATPPRCARRSARCPAPPARSRSSTPGYEREKKRKGLLDFDDLIAACTEALETDPEFAATQRWRFRHLFVDEFQDVTRAQLDLLRGVARRRHRPVRRRRSGPGDLRVRRRGRRAAHPVPARSSRARRSSGSAPTTDRRPRSSKAARAVLPEHERADVRAAGVEGSRPTVTAYADDAAEARGVADALLTGARPDAAVVEHGRAVPGQRAVGAVRRGAGPGRDPLPGARRGGVPRPARGEDRDRRAAQEREDRARPRVRRAPHRSRHRRAGAVRGPARARRRGRRARSRVPRRRRQHRFGQRVPRVPPRVVARWRRRRAARRRRRSAHVPPGEGARVGHRVRHRPRARARADLARERQARRRSTRNAACSTSRSAAPSATCTCRWAKERARGTRVSSRTKSPYLGEVERELGSCPGRDRTRPAAGPRRRPGRGSGSRRWMPASSRVGPPALRRARQPGAASWPAPRPSRRT